MGPIPQRARVPSQGLSSARVKLHTRAVHLFYVLKNLKDSTHNVKDGEDEEQVVEDAVHPLPRERPDGDAVAEHADDADDEDEQPLGRPLKFSKDP